MATIQTRWFQDRLADKGLSQRALARMMRMDAGAMSLMLRGKRKMSVEEAQEVARLLGVGVEEVVTRAGGYGSVSGAVADVRHPTKGVALSRVEPVSVDVPLGAGRVARVVLPERLTGAEAERVAAVVRAFVEG